jgi:hypothetical protein
MHHLWGGGCADTALHRAVYEGQRDIAALLLDAGADASIHNHGLLPVHVAARRGHLDILQVWQLAGTPLASSTSRAATAGEQLLHERDDSVLFQRTTDGASAWLVAKGVQAGAGGVAPAHDLVHGVLCKAFCGGQWPGGDHALALGSPAGVH